MTVAAQPSLVDILAIAAHRDDVEQTCGGTLLKMRSLGLETGILDLTQGEAGTRGSAAERAAEAQAAGQILGVRWRQALDLPDGRVENTYENRLKIVRVLRELRPRVVIVPYWQGSLHHSHSWLRGLFPKRPCAHRNRRSPTSALQGALCQPVRRRPADLCRRHHALHRTALPVAHGLPLPVRKCRAGKRAFCA